MVAPLVSATDNFTYAAAPWVGYRQHGASILASLTPPRIRDGNGDLADDAHETGRRHWTLRVPWLLLAAILLAAALSGLLLFGAR